MFLYGIGSGSDLIKIYRAFRSRPSKHIICCNLVNPRKQGFNVGKNVCFHKSFFKIDMKVDYRNFYLGGIRPGTGGEKFGSGFGSGRNVRIGIRNTETGTWALFTVVNYFSIMFSRKNTILKWKLQKQYSQYKINPFSPFIRAESQTGTSFDKLIFLLLYRFCPFSVWHLAR